VNAARPLVSEGREPRPDPLALGSPAGELDQPVGERRLAMVDMRHNREVADVVDWSRRHGVRLIIPCPHAASAGEAAPARPPIGIRMRYCFCHILSIRCPAGFGTGGGAGGFF